MSNKNGQLKEPSRKSIKRDYVLDLYTQNGYRNLDMWFQNSYRRQIMVHSVYNVLPRTIRAKIKRLLK